MAAKGLRKVADVKDSEILQSLQSHLTGIQVPFVVHSYGWEFHRVFVNVRHLPLAKEAWKQCQSAQRISGV